MSALTPDKQAAAARAARIARDERLTGNLFMTDGEAHLRAQNHAECSRAGIVNHQAIRRHGDALVALMKPVLDETNLTGREVLELRQEMTRSGTSDKESEARRDQFIAGARTPIYGTAKVVAATVQATRAAAHASPALRQALHTGNAPNSVGLTRALHRRVLSGEPILRKPVKVAP
jgi:hypothetical protein